jgi:hypothetical protein
MAKKEIFLKIKKSRKTLKYTFYLLKLKEKDTKKSGIPFKIKGKGYQEIWDTF